VVRRLAYILRFEVAPPFDAESFEGGGSRPKREGSIKMNKVVLGVVLGAILGAVDGATAWFAPEARTKMAGIIIGAAIKGIVIGLASGFFARKVNSIPLGVLFGLGLGFVLAFFVAYHEHSHYLDIMLPGSILGLILGYVTQRYGTYRAAPAGV
jgi:hypothetical protein